MARVRGLNDSERLALDLATVTATGAIIAAPVFLYAVEWTLTDSSVSGLFSIGDTTANTDLVKESTRFDLKENMTVASGASDLHDNFAFNPPVYIANQLFFANATGIRSVSVSYLAAS